MNESFKMQTSQLGLDSLNTNIFHLSKLFSDHHGALFFLQTESILILVCLLTVMEIFEVFSEISQEANITTSTEIWGILNQNDNYLVLHTWSVVSTLHCTLEYILLLLLVIYIHPPSSTTENSSSRFIFILSFYDSYIISFIKLSNCFISKNKITAILFLSFPEPELQLCQVGN